ncbi:MAG: chalcone isomerase family protein [Thiobacillus sp.]|nr:chalcone isomerase family protein [Thiobacillus sp.]
MGTLNRLVGLLGLFTLFLAWAMPAPASPRALAVAGVPLTDQVSVAGQKLLLNGAGLRRILFLKVYVAALYLPERRHEPRAILDRDIPRSLRVTLLRDLSTDQNIEALKGGLVANNNAAEMEAIQAELAQFLGYLKGVHEVTAGTVIHLDYVPGEGTRVGVNGRPLGSVPGRAFNRALLRIWLGEDPIQASLKDALLGG